jgi:hypothetical protein
MVKNSDQSCVSFQTGKDNSPLQFFFNRPTLDKSNYVILFGYSQPVQLAA